MWLETRTLFAGAAPLLDQADRAPPHERIHAAQRLVEDQQLGIVRDRLRQLDALAHALAVAADLLVGGVQQIDASERPRRRRRRRPSLEKPFRRTSAVTHSRPVIRS